MDDHDRQTLALHVHVSFVGCGYVSLFSYRTLLELKRISSSFSSHHNDDSMVICASRKSPGRIFHNASCSPRSTWLYILHRFFFFAFRSFSLRLGSQSLLACLAHVMLISSSGTIRITFKQIGHLNTLLSPKSGRDNRADSSLCDLNRTSCYTLHT